MNTGITYAFGLVGVLAVAALIYAGFQYILALGDDKKVEHAKHIIIGTIIGLIVLGSAFVIVRSVIGIFIPAP